MSDPPSANCVYSDDELLPISALQHLLFCERQCALIHIERVWLENRLTVEGQLLHRKAHEGGDEVRGIVRIARALPLRSARLGLTGVADVVEFHGSARMGDGFVFPVEYKRGKPKAHSADRVQLCAQAICLEEMIGTDISNGALYYGRTRRRLEVQFDPSLRQLTEQTAVRLHALIARGETPRVQRQPKCEHCSLLAICLPGALSPRRNASRYVKRSLERSLSSIGQGFE